MSAQVPGGKGLPTLNLTALIDISALIVIFLIMGTVFGQSSIEVPSILDLPKSDSKDSVNAAPQIVIVKDEVEVNFLNIKMKVSEFQGSQTADLQDKVKKYLESRPKNKIQPDVLLNVIADKETPYSVLYSVLKPFRVSGFESVLFIARGQ